MSGDRLIELLTEIRDQQRQQVENFTRAIAAQNEHLALQRKGRQAFLFMVYAPWVGLALMAAYLLIADGLL